MKDIIIKRINSKVTILRAYIIGNETREIMNSIIDDVNKLICILERYESNEKDIENKISELEKQMKDTNNELVYTRCKYYIQAYKELIDEFRGSN